MRDDEPNSDALADLLSIVSHDVKNGLNVINLGAHQLSSMKGVDAETAARLKRIADMLNRASKRMGDLMRDVVDLARIDSGTLVLETKSFRLSEAIKRSVETLLRDAEERSVAIELSIDGEPLALGDPDRIANVVCILLSNAIRVSPEAGRIVVSASENEGRARVEVRDAGPGVAEAERAQIFVRQEPKPGQKRSLGRGLPLARGVLLAQNGTLEVVSKPGEGAAFVFTLPAATTAPA